MVTRHEGVCPDCGEEKESVITHITQTDCTYQVGEDLVEKDEKRAQNRRKLKG